MTTSTDQLSLFTSRASGIEPSSTELRAVIFNTQHAAATRARAQVDWLAAQQGADVLVLTEVGAGPGGDALVRALGEAGYRSVVAPQGGGDYRTVLAARAAGLSAVSSPVTVMPYRFPLARLTVAGRTVTIGGLYVPSRGSKERRNEDKRAFQSAVAAALPTLVKETSGLFVLAGDLNVLEPGHEPHYAVFGAWEYDFYRAFAGAGLIDAFRTLHPDAAEHSWFGRGGNPYRFDHAFAPAAHQHLIRSCSYLHEPRTAGLTDHSAMELTIALKDEGKP
ncbi:endonuclease/exonuclease/phosphatase family protein [Kitasatospora sp. MAP5-34]|uniref:endonuclease/exonuclease/phosphatase family protein n=1 Tax=Kitasatospora sp. MAP5-34 TaxID=3035102 RepID=UPI002473C5AE|nr:endonuclease/exonuclease/phosphatase family protein [Kitasatospora sp. MAP5-34]MDH6579499.1 exodeoxyribonuclease-3 [Kitasatospora sp. MAP5-34]